MELVMSSALKCCVSFSLTTLLLASPLVAQEGQNRAGISVTPVAYQQGAKPDIVDTAVSAGSFKTLAAALKATALVETLKGKGPFTVFAPTDEAFAKLPAGTVETLLTQQPVARRSGLLEFLAIQLSGESWTKAASNDNCRGTAVWSMTAQQGAIVTAKAD
jgi:uncharacterized surface protein with fasciclin (FAS1) repeats